MNLAGGFAMGPLAQTTEETWDRMVALNLKSAFLVTRAPRPSEAVEACAFEEGRRRQEGLL